MSSFERDSVMELSPQLLVVAGPSGVGKSSVVRRVIELHPRIWLSVSATTRQPRAGEQNGVDYLFMSDQEFDELVATGGFIEWAEFAGNKYGTPATPVTDHLNSGRPVLLEIDLQGVRQVRERFAQARTVFIAPPDSDALRQRLTSRGTESQESLDRRLAVAEEELAAANEFDRTIVNGEIDQAARELIAWAGETN